MRQVRELLGELPHARARRMLDDIAAELAGVRLPLATYRVQLHKGFGFNAAASIAEYLDELGVTDLYTSPYLRAAPGSNHGYDVLDHQQLNPELGTPADHAAMCSAVREKGLGHVLDIVPNHMGIGSGNSLWMDLLENGPSARAARYFDVEWHPVKEELANKVLVPILGDRYGAVLERGELKLRLLNGAFQATYFDHVFPLSPRSYGEILAYRLDELESRLPPGDASLDELKSILTAIEHLPTRHEQDPDRLEERRREKEVIKRRVAALCATDSRLREHLEQNVALYNGEPGKPRSFDRLDKLLGAQAYRLAHWRVSSEEINYRRFFDINSLAAIRVEDPIVFEEAHRIPLRLLAQGLVTGFRVDHPDGLAYPTRYFRLLQDSHILERARAMAEGRGHPWPEIEPAVREELSREIATQGAASPLYKPVYVVAEKILGGTERLPESWAVRGTTGYDFLNQVNGLFVDPAARDVIDKIYSRYIGGHIDFDELVYQKKKLILYTALASEMNLLARQLNRISEANRWTRDFTLYSLRAALIEVVACFPVYRTYVGEDGTVDEHDRKYILQAVACAKRRNPAENASIYEFIADILLQKFADYVVESERPIQLAFVIKLQQVLGPVMAKGLEDTVFYVYNRLLSLNEVGGEPNRFGVSVQQFHAVNELRARSFPRTLLATATHDTKRGEDVRTRIDALSEMPKDWAAALSSWTRKVDGLLRDVDGRKAPDRNELMLFFQTLVGVWPNGYGASLPPKEELESLSQRLSQYMFKAVKEAKVNTSWIQEDKSWEEAVQAFVRDLFALPPRHAFWKAFLPFAEKIARVGAHNSFSQLVLKLASPGVPDIYQGCEVWDLSLVDPDNRRPVDFEMRKKTLREIRADGQPREEVARRLYESWPDGRIKLFLTQAGLRARRENAGVFGDGAYVPLEARGDRADKIVAFARRDEAGAAAICIVPRLVAPFLDKGLLPADAFAETMVPLPFAQEGSELTDAFTGRRCAVKDGGIRVRDAFSALPVALLLT
ncbi:MAG: malto-oligosyltrehalose synthase [Myxococcales bacterium]